MSLVKLPVEVRNQILSDCMWNLYERSWDDKMRCCFEYPGWRSPDLAHLSCRTDFENGRGTHSELWQAMPDMDVEALVEPLRKPKYDGDCRTLPVLYVCRDWYREAISLWYRQYTFAFDSPAALRLFSNNTWEMHNNEFVRDIRIVVNAWDRRECMRLGGHGPYLHAPNWLEWMEFFEEEGRGLLWHFPGLRTLRIDFETDEKHSSFGNYHVDGGELDLLGSFPPADARPLPRQQGFDRFQKMLRTKVRVKKVEVEGLYDWRGLGPEIEREMMGLEMTDCCPASKEAEGRAAEDAFWNAAGF